jgi:hypothetical protein
MLAYSRRYRRCTTCGPLLRTTAVAVPDPARSRKATLRPCTRRATEVPITEFSAGRKRARVCCSGEMPDEAGRLAFRRRGYELKPYAGRFRSPSELAVTDSVIISQDADRLKEIYRALERHAPTLLNFDCRVTCGSPPQADSCRVERGLLSLTQYGGFAYPVPDSRAPNGVRWPRTRGNVRSCR